MTLPYTPHQSSEKPFVLIVTGFSGAGKTEALRCLEDLGFECVDNMPIALIEPMLSQGEVLPLKLALGIDVRTRDLHSHIAALLKSVKAAEHYQGEILFLRAETKELLKRFTTSRRRHPLSKGRSLQESLELEKEWLKELKNVAHVTIDTTTFAPQDFYKVLEGRYADSAEPRLQVFIQSFGFKHGMPEAADMVFDVRHLKNPHWDLALRPFTGVDKAVQDYVKNDAVYAQTFTKMTDLIGFQLEQYQKQDRPYVTLAIGCTGGAHRSVTVCEHVAEWLHEKGYDVMSQHRDREKHIAHHAEKAAREGKKAL